MDVNISGRPTSAPAPTGAEGPWATRIRGRGEQLRSTPNAVGEVTVSLRSAAGAVDSRFAPGGSELEDQASGNVPTQQLGNGLVDLLELASLGDDTRTATGV